MHGNGCHEEVCRVRGRLDENCVGDVTFGGRYKDEELVNPKVAGNGEHVAVYHEKALPALEWLCDVDIHAIISAFAVPLRRPLRNLGLAPCRVAKSDNREKLRNDVCNHSCMQIWVHRTAEVRVDGVQPDTSIWAA
jgi:hypothetical protein